MKKIAGVVLAAGMVACGSPQYNENPSESTAGLSASASAAQESKSFYDFSTESLEGEVFDFSQLKGKRVLVVNTASECGYTPQYEELQELYEQYGGENFTIVGFPSNDFGKQEPGTNEEIQEFCRKNFGVSFPMMAKTPVTGEDKHPVYQWLTAKERNGRKELEVQWNFNKFLVDENGTWFAYFPSRVKPMDERIVSFAKGEKDLKEE